MKISITLLAILLNFLLSSFANAKAFCALRDPVAQIYHMFPQADGFRSTVKTIDINVRNQVLQRLPEQPMHFDELGRHTLYVVMRQQQPIGIVHVRAEQSPWGLVEVAWALNLDLTVVDFAIQRSRAVGTDIINAPSFKQLFIGKNFTALYHYLDDSYGYQQQVKGAQELSMTLLINALKTLLITELAWADELNQLDKAAG